MCCGRAHIQINGSTTNTCLALHFFPLTLSQCACAAAAAAAATAATAAPSNWKRNATNQLNWISASTSWKHWTQHWNVNRHATIRFAQLSSPTPRRTARRCERDTRTGWLDVVKRAQRRARVFATRRHARALYACFALTWNWFNAFDSVLIWLYRSKHTQPARHQTTHSRCSSSTQNTQQFLLSARDWEQLKIKTPPNEKP